MSNENVQGYDKAKAEKFYKRLRVKISRWLQEHKASEQVSNYLLFMPDLFALLMRLMGDSRIDLKIKLQIGGAILYVISPIDLIPDLLFPIGYADDVAVMLFVLNRLTSLLGSAGEEILREHWEGDGDAIIAIKKISATISQVLNPAILGKVRDYIQRLF